MQTLSLPNQKITAAQRERLLCIYLSGDRTEAEALAETFGVNKNYAAKLACDRGYKPMFLNSTSQRPRRLPQDEYDLTIDDVATIERIQATVAAYFGLDASVVTSTRRTAAADHARSIAMFLAWQLTARSYPQIARMFSGGCGHDTILRACQRVKERKSSDPQIESDIAAIEREVMR